MPSKSVKDNELFFHKIRHENPLSDKYFPSDLTITQFIDLSQARELLYFSQWQEANLKGIRLLGLTQILQSLNRLLRSGNKTPKHSSQKFPKLTLFERLRLFRCKIDFNHNVLVSCRQNTLQSYNQQVRLKKKQYLKKVWKNSKLFSKESQQTLKLIAAVGMPCPVPFSVLFFGQNIYRSRLLLRWNFICQDQRVTKPIPLDVFRVIICSI